MRLTVLALGALALSAPALAASVEWGSKPADGTNRSGPNSAAVLGQPDGDGDVDQRSIAASHVRDFKPGKVSAAQLEKAAEAAGRVSWPSGMSSRSKASRPNAPRAGLRFLDVDGQRPQVDQPRRPMTAPPALRWPGAGEGWQFRSGRVALADFKTAVSQATGCSAMAPGS
jgi:hypothetical protein